MAMHCTRKLALEKILGLHYRGFEILSRVFTRPCEISPSKNSHFSTRVEKVRLDPKDIEPAFRTAAKGRANGVLVLPTPVVLSHRAQIAVLAVKSRLPAIYARPEFVEDGGLMTYGVSITDLFRRAATYVDKILKGAKPADLPVEQPTKFEFAINLKAAKQIGLTIPPNVLARADRVIR